MREILFRGKRLDNGEWVASGNLLHADDNGKHSYYIPVYGDRFGTVEDEHDNILSIKYGTFYKVDPATVGQCTKKSDENGKQIFEGDIFDWGYAGVYDKRYVVTYNAETASFIGERGGGFLSLNGIAIKIIGNIHDNPELLEEAK